MYGCDQQCVELLAQAEEMTEGEDNHLLGMSIQPLSYLHENALQENTSFYSTGVVCVTTLRRNKCLYVGVMMEK